MKGSITVEGITGTSKDESRGELQASPGRLRKWIKQWNCAMPGNERQYYKGSQLEGYQTPGPFSHLNQRNKKR